MTLNGWLQILFFLLAVFLVTPPLGRFMARVFARNARGSIRWRGRSSGSSTG